MEAKTWVDTVKMPDDLTPSQQQLHEQIKPYLEAQAELAWKARGPEIEEAEKRGIQKVVDFVEKNLMVIFEGEAMYSRTSGRKTLIMWQAQLKSWGIEQKEEQDGC